jgi:glycosyltransferase involved in cell wall biosynthesis
MELPTVAFDVPVSCEFLGELGVYAEPGNIYSLADGIQSLLVDPTWARSLGRRLRRRAAQNYSWEQAGRHILSIYDPLIRPAHAQQMRKPALAASRPRAEGQEGERL